MLHKSFSIISSMLLVVSTALSQTTPYNGVPASFPGLLAVENFDNGGPNVAYSIWGETGRNGNYQDFRAMEKVSLDQQAGLVQVGWFHGQSWIKYSYDVTVAGSYDVYLTYRCGSWDEPRIVTFDFGRPSLTPVDFNFSFNDMDWNTNLGGETVMAAQGVELELGTGVLTIKNSGNSDMNLVGLELRFNSALGTRKPSYRTLSKRSPAITDFGKNHKWFALPGNKTKGSFADLTGRSFLPLQF